MHATTLHIDIDININAQIHRSPTDRNTLPSRRGTNTEILLLFLAILTETGIAMEIALLDRGATLEADGAGMSADTTGDLLSTLSADAAAAGSIVG
jgi:hypothetical protein